MTALKTSLSDGLKILELTTEMILMNQNSITKLVEKSDSTSSWIQHLMLLRYPITTERDSVVEKKMLCLPWPFGSKVKFERRGDRAGIELKTFIVSEADLVKVISALERVKDSISKI